MREDRKAPVVTANLWVRVGSNCEDESVLGWSHGIEHLMFKGTPRRGPGVAAREIRDAGGLLNAATGYETTNYYVTVPTRSLRVALDVQADAILRSAFDPAELDRERAVIIEENRMYRDQPSGFGHTWERLMSLAFEASNYRRPIGGPDESLRATPRDAILAYRDRWYVPGNAALVVAGDVAAEDAIALAAEAYGGWRAAPIPEAAGVVEPAQRSARFRAAPGNVAKCYVKIGWHGGPETDRDTYAILVFLRLLARGRSSWMYQEMVEKRGLVSEISALQETGCRESVFVLDVVTEPARLDAVAAAVCEGIGVFRDGAVPDEDLERAKNFMVRSHVLAQETVDSQAHALGHSFARGDATLADRFPEIVESITGEDVRRVANAYFDVSQASILVHHPEGAATISLPASFGAPPPARDPRSLSPSGPLSTPPGAQPRLRAAGSQRLGGGATGREAAEAAGPCPRETTTGGLARAAAGGAFRRVVLGGGATLLVKRRPALPSVAFGVFVRCGSALETDAVNGVNALTHRTMVKGTASRTNAQIARDSESLGASIVPAYGSDFSGFTVRTISRFSDPAFEVFADVLARPTFPDNDVESERALLLAEIEQEEDEPFQKTSREFQRALFGSDPYALPAEGSDASVRGLARGQLVSWYERAYRAGDLLFVAAGDLDEDAVEARVREAVAAMSRGAGGSATPAPRPPAAVTAPSGPREVVLEREVNQDVLLVGFRGPDARSDDAYPLQVLSAVMSGMGNRLFVALRDREGLCYYTGMSYRSLDRAGVIVAYVGTSPEKEERARAALDGEIARLLDGGVAVEELARAQNALIGQTAIGRQTNGAEASLAARYELLGVGHEEIDRYERKVLAVTPEDVLRAARRWIRPDERVVAITRPKR